MKRLFIALALVAAGCGDGKVTTESGAAACLTASACGITDGGVSACTAIVSQVNNPELAALVHLGPAEVNCIAKAGHNCAAAKKCMAKGMTPDPCVGDGRSCDGTTLKACTELAGTGDSHGMQLFDCGQIGQMCVVSGSNADCGYGSCSPGAFSCVDAQGKAGGSLVQSCLDGVLRRHDCGQQGGTCAPAAIIGAWCQGTGPTCTTSGTDNSLRCDGSVLVSCLNGAEARHDCAKESLGCFPNSGTSGFRCAAGKDCDPNKYSAVCAGTKLTFCNNGKVDEVDCKSAGFSGCSPDDGGRCTI